MFGLMKGLMKGLSQLSSMFVLGAGVAPVLREAAQPLVCDHANVMISIYVDNDYISSKSILTPFKM